MTRIITTINFVTDDVLRLIVINETKKITFIMETECSLPCSQKSTIVLYSLPLHSFLPCFSKTSFNTIFS
jgi:hypothetical protein